MLKQKNALISLAVSLLVAACGGDSGSSNSTLKTSSTSNTTTTGKVVDGYIAGATVFCDANNNGVVDAGEEKVVSDAQGAFTFSTACSTLIVSSGGTDTATGLSFKGILKAPAGSVVVTPGTSLLVNTSLTMDKLAAALGLPAGTDITTLDPAAVGTDGKPTNAAVLQRTLAIQQIVQQTADAIAALTQNSTPSQSQSIYVETTRAAGTVIVQKSSSTTLISTNGTVDPDLVNAIVQQALTNVAASTDALLAALKADIAKFSKIDVAALVAPLIVQQAQTLTTSAISDVLTKATQSDTAVVDAVIQAVDQSQIAIINQ